jgi:hypothetical protein
MSGKPERRKRTRGAGEELDSGSRRAPPATAAKRSRLAPPLGERQRRELEEEGQEGREGGAKGGLRWPGREAAREQGQGRQRECAEAGTEEFFGMQSESVAMAAVAVAHEPPPQECGICLEAIGERGVLDSCAHMFCYACIDRWLARSCRCPLCKRAVTTLSSARGIGPGLMAVPLSVPALTSSAASASQAAMSVGSGLPPRFAALGVSSSSSGPVPVKIFGPAHAGGCATPPRKVKRVAQRELRETLQREDDEDSEEDIHDLLDQISVVARTLGLRFTYRHRTVLDGVGAGPSAAGAPPCPDSRSACEPGSGARLSDLVVSRTAGSYSTFNFNDLLVSDSPQSAQVPGRCHQVHLQREPSKHQLEPQDGAALAAAIEQLESEPEDRAAELFPTSLVASSSSSSFFSSLSSSSSSAALQPVTRSRAGPSANLSPEELLLASILSGADLPSQRRRVDRGADPRKDAGGAACTGSSAL